MIPGCLVGWCGDVRCGRGGKMHVAHNWIGEVGLGPWVRSSLSGDVAVEEGFGVVSGCET